VVKIIEGKTWLDLWRAAEECIVASEDSHHIFIEAFYPERNDPTTLSLGTGS
jgi:hypothetical protein